jgi:pimeloyl-ACP methyl ester carboxylesterase
MRVLLLPGGGSLAAGYYRDLPAALAGRAEALELDPPALDPEADRSWLRYADHAGAVASAVRRGGEEPVLAVGHSHGALVALRIALDAPGLVGGLVLLDPMAFAPASLLPWGTWLAPVCRLRLGRRNRTHVRPRTSREIVLWGRRMLWDGLVLAADLRRLRLPATPTVVVSAGKHAPDSASRRSHELIAEWIPGAELQVWAGAGHGLHEEQPERATGLVLELLERLRPTQ